MAINENQDGQTIQLESQEILYFSAIICSTDSVAALTLIKPKEHPKLFSIIFGEGMINDAVSIILFQCVNLVYKNRDNTQFHYKELLFQILYITLMSILLGILGGILPAMLFKKMKSWQINLPPISEISLVLFFGHFTYMFCDYLKLSGILGILIASFLLSHYSFYNISTVSQQTIGIILNTFAYFAEGFLFIYLGLSSLLTQADWSFSFFGLTILSILLARFIAVFGMSFIGQLYYACRGEVWRLSLQEVCIIYFAGLIRGAIAFALVLSLRSLNFSLIKSNTLILVLTTTILLGGMMSFIIAHFQSKNTSLTKPLMHLHS